MLKDKVAIITGSNRGIGRAIALDFIENNAKVVINYRNGKDEAEELLKLIQGQNKEAYLVQGDISLEEDVKRLINKTLEKFGRIDVLVNNAGINKDGLIMRMSESDFLDVINVNLKGSFNCLKYASNVMMKQRSGKIINLSSVIGLIGNIGQANYAAAKAGLIGLTKSAAKELALRGINVNAIAPGFIKTDMTDKLSDKIKEDTLLHIPLKRFGEAKEIASVATFLASDMSSYVTGQVISVDGGMVM